MFVFPPSVIDLSVSHAIQRFQPAWLTTAMKFLTATFAPEVMIFVCLLLAILAYNRHRPSRAVMILLLTSGNLLTLLLKHFFQRPRPAAALVHVLVRETDSGFPSGHALGMVLVLAVVLTYVWRSRSVPVRWLVGIVTTLIVLLVGYSRLYLGVHWVSDVLAGYGFGFLWVCICYTILRPLVRSQKKPQQPVQ